MAGRVAADTKGLCCHKWLPEVRFNIAHRRIKWQPTDEAGSEDDSTHSVFLGVARVDTG